MGKSKYTTVVGYNDVEEDGELSEEARLGAVVERGGSKDFQLNEQSKEKLVVVGAADLGKDHLDDWTASGVKVGSGETVTTKQLETGDRFRLWLEAGTALTTSSNANISKGEDLIVAQTSASAYNGALKSGSGSGDLVAEESVDNSGGSNPVRIEVKVKG